MDHFNYRNNQLFAEDVSISDIVSRVKTPFYLYSTATLERHFKMIDEAIILKNKMICFAVKSNTNIAVLRTLANLGAGADVVSQGEIFKSLKAGIVPQKIVFSGIGKTREEISYGLQQGIFQFNVESQEEILMINDIAADLGKIAAIAIRINPNVNANTHDKISTGKKGDKFGIDIEQAIEVIKLAISLKYIKFQGLSIHIGSQITNLDVFKKAFIKLFEFITELRRQNIMVSTIDLGGGLGAVYDKTDVILPNEYGKLVSDLAGDFNLEQQKFIFEPGRIISANAGVLVSSVILIKQTDHKNFMICDAAMNDLMRPALYDAVHQFVPVIKENVALQKYDIVGPVCETTDVFIKDLEFPTVKVRDIFAIRGTGAYGAVMSSEYNSRPLIPEVMVKDSDYDVIRSRPPLEEMIKKEKLPKWL